MVIKLTKLFHLILIFSFGTDRKKGFVEKSYEPLYLEILPIGTHISKVLYVK